jgi:hypothetical protein
MCALQFRRHRLGTPSLIRAYGKALRPQMVMLSEEARPDDARGDLILIGGPRTNSVTRQAFEVPGLPVYVTDTPRPDDADTVDSRIHWAAEGDPEILATSDEGDCVYGLVLHHRNVLDSGSRSWLWVFAGSSTFGTQAAVEWFIANRRTVRRAQRRKSVAFVVRAATWPDGRGITTPETYRQLGHA